MNKETKSRSNFQHLFQQNQSKVSQEIFSDSLALKSRAELIAELHKMRDCLDLADAKLISVLEISSIIRKTLDYNELLFDMIERICQFIRAERSTLFIIDDNGETISSQVLLKEKKTQIRLPLGEGIAGWVAKTGETINSTNVYDNPHFNPDFDRETGFETHSMMCVPVRNHIGEIIGAVQVLNSETGFFTKEDEDLLTAIACQAGIVIENQKLYQSVLESNKHLAEVKRRLEHRVMELNLIHDIEYHITRATSLNAMLRIFTRKTARILNVEAVTVSLNVGDQARLYISSLSPHDNWGFQIKVFRNDEIINAFKEIFSNVLERNHGYYLDENLVNYFRDSGKMDFLHGQQSRIRNMISMPLFDEDDNLMGVVSAINSQSQGTFLEYDTRLLSLIASRVGGVILARRRAEELANSERLATIGGMLAGVVHDLKNPITVISGYIQLMERADDPEVRKKFRKLCLQQLTQLTDMTRELLIFAKGESSLQRREVKLESHFANLENVLRQELSQRNICLKIDLQYKGTARLDPAKLDRVILNLVRNAADAMEEKGGQVTIRVYEEDQNLVFSVSDTGNGIPLEVRGTLFDSFVTFGKKHGTGLGLAIVKNIVDLHSGDISFVTTTGKGTTFYVKIPLRNGNSSRPSA